MNRLDPTTVGIDDRRTSRYLPRPDWLAEQQWPFALRRYRHEVAGPEDTARSSGRRGRAGAIDVHYTDEGTGPTLVFVHTGMWSFIWRDTIAALRSDFRCIALDFPATGLSEGSAGDIDFSTYPDLLNGLLDHIGVERATFVVHDLGGSVGVAAAGERPERMAGLVATNSFAWRPAGRGLTLMLGFMGSRAAVATLGTARLIPRLSRTRFGVGRHFDRVDRRSFFGPYRSRARSRDFHRTMGSAAASTATFDRAAAALRGPLRQLPVLTVFGENNDQFGFAETWKQYFPDAEQFTTIGGNHFPMCDDPDDYVARLRSWHRCRVTGG